jgi:hypothetical protein
MSGPVGSEYPGNIVMSTAACFFAVISVRSALSARRWRRQNAKHQDWQSEAWFSFLALLVCAFSIYAVWAHW